jgi:ribosome-binding protein aMBF1 (putative translation factor)
MNHPLAQAYETYIQSVEESRKIKNSARRTFGKELRAARKSLGMSVRELGEKIGITGSLINQVEMTGKSVLKKNIIERIVELCYAAGNRSEPKSEGSSQSATSEGN